jgi:hypothetical protein
LFIPMLYVVVRSLVPRKKPAVIPEPSV